MMIPHYEFGSGNRILHFAHANGFPPRAYTPLLNQLASYKYRVISMPARPLWTNSKPQDLRNWQLMSEDLASFLQRDYPRLIGVGHSMGATATLQAAVKYPNLFSIIVLLDPVIILPPVSWLWPVLQNLNGNFFFPLVAAALKRKRIFESTQVMYHHYRRKKVFIRISDEGLWAYVESLAKPRSDGMIELSYPPQWEAQIYATAPHHLWRILRNLKVPLLIVWGKHSDTFFSASVRAIRRKIPSARFHQIKNGGHLFPMEHPNQTAEIINQFLTNATF